MKARFIAVTMTACWLVFRVGAGSTPVILAAQNTATQKLAVTEGRLLQKIAPVYPPVARQAGIQGTVVLHAVIGKDGLLNSITVVSGPPLLQQAAVDAVRQWKYEPYLLGGQPVEVVTTLNIVFSLGDDSMPQVSRACAEAFQRWPSVQAVGTGTPPPPDDARLETLDKLANDFFDGANGNPKNTELGISWYRKAAEGGLTKAQYTLGTIYSKGLGGLQQDNVQAAYWFRKAAEHGDAGSEFNIGLFYENALGGLPPDIEHAVAWYCKAAHEGSANALAALNRLAFQSPSEQQQQITDFEAARCTTRDPRSKNDQQADQECIENRQRAAAEALFHAQQKKEHEEQVAADKASAVTHTTHFHGLYIGQYRENAKVKKSGCRFYDKYVETALENIGTGKSTTECLIDFDYKSTIDKIVLFTRIPYLKEYYTLVGQYGASLPGRYPELSQDAPDCCNLWHTKDATSIWERPAHLKMRGTPETAYQPTVVYYTIVVFESQR